jgi:hypothetical protein
VSIFRQNAHPRHAGYPLEVRSVVGDNAPTMNEKTQKAFEAIRTCIDNECAPATLTRSEYAEVLEELAGDIEARLDAVNDEIDEEESDDEDSDEDE